MFILLLLYGACQGFRWVLLPAGEDKDETSIPYSDLETAERIVGNPDLFAIESEIARAYERPGQLALGFFVIRMMGRIYGVREPNTTMLARSFDEVGRRIARRGSHRSPFAMDTDSKEIAYAFRRAVYGEYDAHEQFFGTPSAQFREAIDSNHLVWAPDGDEAFDDSSYVLHFEDDNRVRLVAFAGSSDFLYERASLQDVCLRQEESYAILQEWHGRFRDEWTSLPKVSIEGSAGDLSG